MRRLQQAVTNPDEIEAILAAGQVCHLAINTGDGQAPYLVALNFGYDYLADSAPGSRAGSLNLWFHCALEGYKLDLIAANAQVGFQVLSSLAVISKSDDAACDWAMQYQSIVGSGVIDLVTDPSQKLYGLGRLVAHYGGSHLPFNEDSLARSAVLQLSVDQFSAKRSRNLLPAT